MAGFAIQRGEKIKVTETTTLYAVWDMDVNPEQVTLRYIDRGKTAYPDETYDKGTSVEIKPCNNTNTDYMFKGWSTSSDEDAAVNYEPGSPIVLNESTTLYAVWEKMLTPTPAIEVTKSVNGSTDVKPGDEVIFTIEVENTGNVDFTTVVVLDELPDGLTYVRATGNPMLTTNPVVWFPPGLAAEDLLTFTVTAKVDDTAVGTLTNIVRAIGYTTDSGQADGLDSAPVTVKTSEIEIPGTEISYPLLQGQDNQFYLTHNWKKEESAGGSLFLEVTGSSSLTDFNTIIYGHRMRNETMFGSLKYYEEPDFWRKHPSVYIVLDSVVYRYDIFSAQKAGIKEMVYRLDIEEKGLEEELISWCVENSVIDTGLVPTEEDRILTLSTCTGSGYSGRWIVQRVLVQVYDRENAAV